MARVLTVTSSGRCYICGLRLHHGLTGTALVALGVTFGRRVLVGVGALLVLHDFRDWPWPLVDP